MQTIGHYMPRGPSAVTKTDQEGAVFEEKVEKRIRVNA